MSQPPPSPPSHNHSNPKSLHLHKPTSLPDLIFTALSLFFLFSPSKPNTTTTPTFKIPFFSFSHHSRRFFRNPIMSSHTDPNSNTHPFANPQALSDWLKPRLPSESFTSWGVKPGTKNVHNLWLELSEGETLLADSTPPIRTVEVVTVRIKDTHNRILVESYQELSDGTIRNRNRPLSEKMKPGETVDSAVMRAIKEELGSLLYKGSCDEYTGEIVKIIPDSYRKKMEERVSASYPGLPACYVLHMVDASINGLPNEEFWTEEEEEYKDCNETRIADKAVSVKRHHWKWVDFDEV